MNAAPNTKPFRPRKKSVAVEQTQADFSGLPETDVNSPPHTTASASPKSGETPPAAGQSVSADESSPAPGSGDGTISAPSAAGPLSAAPSNEGAELATVGAEPSTALTVVGDVRVAMRSEQTRADIAKLLDTAKAITVITNADGRQQAHSLLMSLVKTRTAIDSRYEEVSANVRSFLDDTQTERDDLKKLSAEQEARIRKLRDDWDEDQKRIKRERAEAEQRRIDAIKARIDAIKAYRDRADGQTAEAIQGLIQDLVALPIGDDFAEFKAEALNTQAFTLDALRYKHANAMELERRAAELAEQERKLEHERAELSRIAAHKAALQKRIDAIKAFSDGTDLITAEQVLTKLSEARAFVVDESFAEAYGEAEEARQTAIQRLLDIHGSRVQVEAEHARIREQEAAAVKRESAMEAIRTIQDRLADAAAGDSLEAYDLAISVTQGEPMTEERFGPLLATATKIRDNTYQTLRQRRIALAKRLLEEAEFARRKAEQERQEQEAETARKLREQRISGINFIRAVVGMSASLTTLAEFDTAIADTAALETSVEVYGDMSVEAIDARNYTLDFLRARRQILADRLAQEAAALSRETLAPPTDPAEATDGEMASDASEIALAATQELPVEADAPSVDEAILTTLDALAVAYGLDDVRGKELIVRMGARAQELAA